MQSENVKRLKAVSITPKGNLVVIGGENGAGKTSVLDSIWYALGGKGAACDQPVRVGTEKAEVNLDLGEFKVRRTFTPAGGGTLTVSNAEGNGTFNSPQSMLDAMVGKISFDPLAFTRDKDQVGTLKQLVGLDFTDVDSRRKKLYDERAEVNKEVKRLQVNIEQTPEKEGANESEVSVDDMTARLVVAQEDNKSNEDERAQLTELERKFEASEQGEKALVARISELENLLANTRQQLTDAQARTGGIAADCEAQRAKVDALVDRDIDAVREEIAAIQAGNDALLHNQKRAALVKERDERKAISDAKTEAINACDAEKAKALQETKFPIEGLSFSDDGVLYNDIPFSQCSGAEQLRISVAIGLAMNPKLKVILIRDGSLLDETNLEMIAEMAAVADAQVWVERVGEGDECQIVIEDGHIKGAE
jgi:energy-coupling factor transporter ATP-binding protein EcfA2